MSKYDIIISIKNKERANHMSKLLTILVSFIIGVVVTVLVGMNQLPGMMIKEIPSPLGFE